MAASFCSFSTLRSSTAFCMAFSISRMSSCKSAILCVSSASVAINLSAFAVSSSTSCDLMVRVFLLVAISASHQALWSASPDASSSNLVIKSRSICLTLSKGSLAACFANIASVGLSVAAALAASRAATRVNAVGRGPDCRRNCAKELPPAAAAAPPPGRRSPATSEEETMSMALASAWSSSSRSCCLLSKSALLALQSPVSSVKYFSSAAFAASVLSFSPWALALSASRSALNLTFCPISCRARSACAVSR
mmetsp:Transcript_31574/g.79719  ORF Transcript_31574/g.79719 Transcript_31574/m.79719 type:complete len:252 (-) Transcript_31574:668-1423(-)